LLSAHLVAHTHWDREWYHTFVRFRQRLVALVDELLDDPPGPNESFLLDGQAVVLEDYLAVRPEREEELAGLLWSGRLEAGPWYVLADELIPSGEALARNLLLGRRVLRRFHADAPPVLYCPDSFGHPAALPALATGFGFPLIVLWRGFGGPRWPATDTFVWHAPDGERVIAFHLPPNGYEFGSDLPADPTDARARWNEMRRILERRAATGVVLVQNGADHHARQLGQRAAADALASAAAESGDTLRASSLRIFAEALLEKARRRDLSEVSGELRDSSGYTWSLQGTFGTRAAQKRRNAFAERLLVRDAEPWAAFARWRGAKSRVPLLVAAWRTLLQTHPHDTLCGCAIDAVADAMDRRLDDALAQGAGLRDDALADIVGHDPAAARVAHSLWRPYVLVRNRAPRPRGGVAIIEIAQFMAHVAVGPGSAPEPAQSSLPTPGPPSLPGYLLQPLATRLAFDRAESPRHYPDNDLVAITRAAVWIDALPAYGLRALPLGTPGHAVAGMRVTPQEVMNIGTTAETSRQSPNAAHLVRAESATVENGIVRVTASDAGRLTLECSDGERRVLDLIALDDRVDRGDLYTASIRELASVVELEGMRVAHAGPLLGEIRLDWRLVPVQHLRGRRARTSKFTARVILTADSPLVRVHVTGCNKLHDHRLRLVLRTDVSNPEVWADAPFGAVHRAPLVAPDESRTMETPPPTAPLHRYVSVFSARRGATLFSDGLAEYEAHRDGRISLTLVRAVGELSRNDLPERPGHAGWPIPTPRAQCVGPYAARFALLLHGSRTPPTIDQIERAADDALLPLEGRTLRSAIAVPPPISGAELIGAGLAFSALKQSEDGEWVVARCVNLLDAPVDGAWRFGVPVREARNSRLDETPLAGLAVTDEGVAFRAEPRAIITILIR
jgi:2-O-(6-phospho-alpha-D-mannosyl)-D-glycerate hydrolase